MKNSPKLSGNNIFMFRQGVLRVAMLSHGSQNKVQAQAPLEVLSPCLSAPLHVYLSSLPFFVPTSVICNAFNLLQGSNEGDNNVIDNYGD